MRVIVHTRAHDRGRAVAAAFADGCRSHGCDVRQLPPHSEPQYDADVACVWGVRTAFRWYQAAKIPTVVAEAGYVGDRDVWTSLGWDGLNGMARFPARLAGDRWARYFPRELKPWRPDHPAGRVLIVGQVTGDAAVEAVTLPDWYAAQVRALTGRAIWFRPHPKRPGDRVAGVALADAPLEDVLERSSAVVTYSSTVGVTAILRGLPTVVASPISMAYPVGLRHVADLPRAREPGGRARWADRLAYCQWTLGEIASGEAWSHLADEVHREAIA